VAERTVTVYNAAMATPPPPLVERFRRYCGIGRVFGPVAVIAMALFHFMVTALEFALPAWQTDIVPELVFPAIDETEAPASLKGDYAAVARPVPGGVVAPLQVQAVTPSIALPPPLAAAVAGAGAGGSKSGAATPVKRSRESSSSSVSSLPALPGGAGVVVDDATGSVLLATDAFPTFTRPGSRPSHVVVASVAPAVAAASLAAAGGTPPRRGSAGAVAAAAAAGRGAGATPPKGAPAEVAAGAGGRKRPSPAAGSGAPAASAAAGAAFGAAASRSDAATAAARRSSAGAPAGVGADLWEAERQRAQRERAQAAAGAAHAPGRERAAGGALQRRPHAAEGSAVEPGRGVAERSVSFASRDSSSRGTSPAGSASYPSEDSQRASPDRAALHGAAAFAGEGHAGGSPYGPYSPADAASGAGVALPSGLPSTLSLPPGPAPGLSQRRGDVGSGGGLSQFQPPSAIDAAATPTATPTASATATGSDYTGHTPGSATVSGGVIGALRFGGPSQQQQQFAAGSPLAAGSAARPPAGAAARPRHGAGSAAGSGGGMRHYSVARELGRLHIRTGVSTSDYGTVQATPMATDGTELEENEGGRAAFDGAAAAAFSGGAYHAARLAGALGGAYSATPGSHRSETSYGTHSGLSSARHSRTCDGAGGGEEEEGAGAAAGGSAAQDSGRGEAGRSAAHPQPGESLRPVRREASQETLSDDYTAAGEASPAASPTASP
jgi:hypothetical protein